MRIYIVLIICISLFTNSCGQEKKTNTKKNIIKMKNDCDGLTSENLVSKIFNEVKHYEKEPQYFIRPIQNNCTYEILVNDFPIYEDYSIDVLATPLGINIGILKSGEQTLTVRMYPIGDLLKDNYGIGNTVTTLLDNTSMKIEVVKYDAYNISHQLSDEKTVLTHYSPTKEGTKKFIGAGLPYYEYTFSFNAEVPYENEGWLNGEDLTQFDKEDIKTALAKIYKNTRDNFDDEDYISCVFYNGFLRNSKAKYKDKVEIEETCLELKKSVSIKKKDFFDLENCEIQFYGNNKIVVLKHSFTNPIDPRLRGKSGFGYKYEEEEDVFAEWLDIYLYIPKGGTLADLQPIK